MLALGVSLLIGELALRGFWVNPYRNERQERVLRLRMYQPGKDMPVDRRSIAPALPPSRLRTDERSFILPVGRFANPDATIAFLGGSTTACVAVAEELRFPGLVSTLLERRGLRVNTLNAARSGATSHDSLNVVLNHLVQERPDVMLMMHGWNDVGVLAVDGSYRSRLALPMSFRSVARWAVHAASFRSSWGGLLRTTIEDYLTGGARPTEASRVRRQQQRVPVLEFSRRLRAFVALARAFDIRPVLMTQPSLGRRVAATPDWTDAANQQRFNERVRELARDQGVALIDLAQHVAERGGDPAEIFYDGVHVTDLGSQLYAEYIAARVVELGLVPRRPGPQRRVRPDASLERE